jgi:flagellar motor protein MotB
LAIRPQNCYRTPIPGHVRNSHSHVLPYGSVEDAYNQDLSLRRADSVRGYLAGKGIASARLTSAGRGESAPVATNESAAGRQQNRRVEVVIENDMPAAVVTR